MFLALAIFAYLFGSIPFGKIVGFKYGVDIQKHGSGNIGFANSLRVLGLKPALVVLLGDLLKGFIPIKLALQVLPFNQVLWIALISILAHIFPIWLRLRGGKGVATSIGVTLALNPFLGIMGIFLWVVISHTTKLHSLASLIVIWSIAVVSYFLFKELLIFYVILSLLITWTHRQNINRLLKGIEKEVTK